MNYSSYLWKIVVGIAVKFNVSYDYPIKAINILSSYWVYIFIMFDDN